MTGPAQRPPQQVSTVARHREEILAYRARGMEIAAICTRLSEVHGVPVSYDAVWRLVRGRWRVVAHPILDATGRFRTPLQLRPVEYRITVAAGRLAAAQTSLHLTRRLLQSLRAQ